MAELAAKTPNATAGGPFGSNLVQTDYAPDGVPVIRGQNMGLGRWISGEFVFVTSEKADALSVNLARPGDLVFTQRGTLGQVAIVPPEPFGEYVISQSQMKLTPDTRRANALFLYYCFVGPKQQEYVRQNAVQTGVPHTNLGTLRKTRVRLPALPEQLRIARVLGALDDKIDHNRRASSHIQEFAQHEFRRWFAAQVDAPTVVVSELIESGALVVGDGYRAKNAEMSDQGVRFIRGRDVGEDIDVKSADLLGWDGVRSAGEKQGRVGDVFFTAKGTVGRTGRVSRWTPGFVYSPQIAFWRALKPEVVPPDFLYLWITSGEFLEQRDSVKGQTDMADYVNLRDQRAMRITLPDPREQSRLSGVVGPLLEAQALLRRESSHLAAVRDTLLPSLVSGSIRVPESYDADDVFDSVADEAGAP